MNKIIIDANKHKLFPNLKILYNYKDLFVTLTWRDFRVRYAQTKIGLLWALLQPVSTLAILTLVFNKFAGVETQVPYILFAVAGTSIWTYFSYVITNSGNSLISNQNMIKKIYFPRIIIPLSKAVVGFVDYGITLLIMIALMFYYQITPSSNIIYAPIFILIAIIAALAVGIWLSALTIRFRDFQHVIPFMVQIGLYITPIAYPIELVSKNLPIWAQSIYFLNPMAGVVQGFRWSIFGGEPLTGLFYLSFFVIIILFISALMYFNKVEKNMADLI